MKKMNFYFNPTKVGLLCMMVLSLFAARLSAQTCAPLNYTFTEAANCPDNALPAGVISLERGTPALITSADIGKTIRYIGTGNCWNTITVEDKTGGVITKPVDLVLPCDFFGDVNNLLRTGQFPNAQNSVKNAAAPATQFSLIPGAAHGTVVECSKYNQSYSDAFYDLSNTIAVPAIDQCKGGTIRRSWSIKDIWGNQSNTVVQNITIQPAPAYNDAAVKALVTNGNLLCQNVTAAYRAQLIAGATSPANSGLNAFIPAISGCKLSLSFVGAVTFDGCLGSYKIVRTWRVMDLCFDGSVTHPTMSYDYQQTIFVDDKEAPTGTVSYQNYSARVGEYCFYMNTMRMNRGAAPGNYQIVTAQVPVTEAMKPTAIILAPRADENMCDAATVFFNMKASDACSGGAAADIVYTSSDSRVKLYTTSNTSGAGASTVTVKGGATIYVRGFIMKSQGTSFVINATDPCGNTTPQAFNVNIVDNVTPNPVCIQAHRVTLNSNGTSRVYTATFNNGSTDNCGIERIHVRRMDKNVAGATACNYTTVPTDSTCAATEERDYFNDYVDFDCGDVGKTVMVQVRYIDAAGNFADCMVNVTVDDKSAPVCQSPQNIAYNCNDLRLLNYKDLFTTPAAYDNCGIRNLNPAPEFDKDLLVGCTKTEVTATWTFTDCANNITKCSQLLTVNPIRGFRVDTLPSLDLTCSYTPDLAAAKAEVVRNLRLLHSGTKTNGDALIYLVDGTLRTKYVNTPYVGNVFAAAVPNKPINANLAEVDGFQTCAGPIVEAEEWVYSNTEYCKVYVQTFTIKDICDFSPNGDGLQYGSRISRTGVENGAKNDYIPTFTNTLQSEIVLGADGKEYHIIRFTRTIRVKDNTPPTAAVVTNQVICDGTTTANTRSAVDTDAGECRFGFTATLGGSDLCTGGTPVATNATGAGLFYTWRITNPDGSTPTSATSSAMSGTSPGVVTAGVSSLTIGATGLAFGTYRVTYQVSDLCGNLSLAQTFTVEGKDCKAPEILVHNKVVELAGVYGSGVGMAALNYDDIKNRIQDNCTGILTNDSKVTLERATPTVAGAAPATAVGTKSIMLNCGDAGKVVLVRVWANDNPANPAAGNWNFVETQITVQDNIGICTARPIVAGTIGTEAGAPVKDVVVSANANGIVAGSATSAAAGTFQVTGLNAGTNYQVRAAKTIDSDKKNGVTTLDIALISKHLLAETELNSAYKIIAADVDKNGEVDATDMLHIRRFILSITSNLPAGSAWRFVDKSYAFRNATNPLGEDFPEVVSLANVPVGTNPANFTAVKLGDVNNSFDAATVRGSRVLAFNAEDMAITAGNEYTVAISAENMTAAAFQGTFSFDGAKVKAVKAGSLNNVTDNNFNMTANAVAASWNGKSEAGASVANITFLATKSGKLSDMLTVNSALTMAEGYDAAGNAMNVTLKFNNGKVAGGEFALYQNTPNPVASSTKIGFNLPKDGQAKLTIYTAEGKVLSVTNNNYKAGYNEVTVNKSDLNASGMLYYRLDTQDNSSTRKMIVIE